MTGTLFDEAVKLIAEADGFYQERDWRTAIDRYRLLQARHPEFAAARAVDLTIGHCAIELAPAGASDRTADIAGIQGTDRDLKLITDLRIRVLELCFGRDFHRASQLLRLMARCDRSIQGAYETVSKGPSSCLEFLDAVPAPADPPFLKTLMVPPAELAEAKRRQAGKRVLLVYQRYTDDPARRHDMVDNLTRSAREFGLVVHEFNSHVLKPGSTVDDFAPNLQQEIIAFRPDVIFFDDLFHLGISAVSDAVAEQVASMLEQVRTLLGVRVVRSLPDGWNTALKGDDHLFRGFGRSVDLLHHCHPKILGRGSAAQQANTWCYTYPTSLEPASVARAGIARACFVGTVHYASIARAVWWAEAAGQGLPIDFVVTLPWQTAHLNHPPISDTAYSNLLVGHQFVLNLTQRLGETCILTGRTIEALLAGSVLLEENSVDSAYFFQPGLHYMPFESLADLRVLIERLLTQPERCRALADAGRQWAARYCSGEVFWAELFARLDRL